MYVRTISETRGTSREVDWGNGPSLRFLIEDDGMGFSICHTTVRAGTEALLQYRNHLEACFCIAGSGEIEDMEGNVHQIQPGDLYVLDKFDRHYLRGGRNEDMVLLSVFNPPLSGSEKHDLNDPEGSTY